MSFRNIRLIYAREIRDQLRDRRTLFMIAVLPLLLYPLLGMSVLQLTQFVRKSEPRVLVLGSAKLKDEPWIPPLFQDDKFSTTLVDKPELVGQMKLEFAEADLASSETEKGPPRGKRKSEKERLKTGELDVVLRFPPDFVKQLAALREQVKRRTVETSPAPDYTPNNTQATPSDKTATIPEPQLLFNSSKERSQIAHRLVEQLLTVWKGQIIRENLLAGQVPPNIARPFQLDARDVAERQQQQVLMWSKILPFVLFIWALTGAFYPAVDLCAGEKERGTLETLLSSPAMRSEIVWGKLFTIMTFSVATALLNLLSIGITARYAIAKLNELPFDRLSDRLDLPPLVSLLWLIVALVPMSAFFSALCLACAAFARSTKEGQYYLMPLFLVSMPLMMLPLSPGTEMTLGNSLIPITGVVMLVMNLVQGDYGVAMRYAVPVCVVTILCCHLAIRWAVYQFNQESVLFRESERLDPRRWLVHLVRDRQDTPSLAEACFCGVLILVIQFFVQLALPAELPANPTFRFLLMIVFISQVVCIALPALMMTLFLTQKPLVSLSLSRLPSLGTCGVAVLLAVSLHPFGSQLGEWINLLYPISPQVLANLDGLGKLFQCGSPPWLPYVLLAVVPAICEELAFRGFILSGLRHVGSKWWAIGLSAILFGISHGSLAIQQALSAAILGMVIGYLAVQSSSLVPCMLFHMTYNGLMFATQLWPSIIQTRPSLAVLVNDTSSGRLLYDWRITGLGVALASVLILWLHRLPYQATREEIIGRARAKQTQMPGSV